jgi:HPt (histidine-containing phosphotransfer) domain-containing protein
VNTKLFNHDTLGTWQQIDPENWRKIAIDILVVFFDAVQSQTDELFHAMDSKDRIRTKAAAHKLKSSCGNVGADAAHSFLDDLEKSSLELEAQQFSDKKSEFRKLIEATLVEAKAFETTLQ